MRLPDFIRYPLRAWAHKKTQTEPDFIIRPNGRDQVRRWWIIPRNRFFNIYLHQFLLSDEDRALHDHPWDNCSILISGNYIEHVRERKAIPGIFGEVMGYKETIFNYHRREGFIYFRRAESAHRVELIQQMSFSGDIENFIGKPAGYSPVITLFITGFKRREWGFWCPQGWRHWEEFCDVRDHGVIGRGCE